MFSSLPISLSLAWLAGTEPDLLAHAYTDRARFASLGLSVLSAVLVIGIAAVVAVGFLVGKWGVILLPMVSPTAAVCFRRALRWVSAGVHFGRRASLLGVGLALLSGILELPLGRALFHSVAIESIATLDSLNVLHWALRFVLALLLLVPLYGIVAARKGSYALAIAKRNELKRLLT
jgi:hypothetical protein